MSALQQALDQYLVIRRSLGYELRNVEWILCGFVAFLDSKGASHITTQCSATTTMMALPISMS